MNKNISEFVLKTPQLLKKKNTSYGNTNFKTDLKDKYDIDYFINEYLNKKNENAVIVNSKKISDYDIFVNIKYESIVNLQKVNDIRYINKYFEKVNSLLPFNGIFIGTFESSHQRFNRIINKYPKVYGYFFFFCTFVLKCIFPKWGLTKKIYFCLTKGKNRYLSMAEVLGRLISCGFQIVDYRELNYHSFFVSKKIGAPAFNNNVSYGIIVKLPRYGIHEKVINVYKIRTMHPYAEYLQEFIHNNNSLKDGGKFKNDFRITSWGRILRKCWLDELPMLFNLITGDLKIVGVRPLSKHYLSLYSEELRDLRKETKPGLFPPFYVDMPITLEEIMESEKRYLMQYFEKPLITDVVYFSKIFMNIILKGKRSS